MSRALPPLLELHAPSRLALSAAVVLVLASVLPQVAAADDVSTGRRVLGTALGSVDGALIARAVTLNSERSPMVAALYLGAVVGGGAIGYALADSDDALTAMGIAMIPLVVVNVVLPPARLDAGQDELSGASWPLLAARCVPTPVPGGWRAAPIQLRF